MLITVGTAPCKDGELVVDDYVPLSFRAYEGVLPGPFLWRTGDMDATLFEMKIDCESHVVCAVTLTAFSGVLLHELPDDRFNVPAKSGLPTVDVSRFPHADFPANRIDEIRNLRLIMLKDEIFVIFDEELTPEQCISCDRLRFFVAATGAIFAVGFFNLTADEMTTIASSVDG